MIKQAYKEYVKIVSKTFRPFVKTFYLEISLTDSNSSALFY